MTDWETFLKAAAAEPDIAALRQTLGEVSAELRRLEASASDLRQRIAPSTALTSAREVPVPVDRATESKDMAEWKLARYRARRKFRVVDAMRRPRSPRDLARMLRDVIREALTPSQLPPRPEPPVVSAPEPHPSEVARSLIDAGNHEEALELIDAFDPHNRDRGSVILRRDAFFGMGALSRAAEVLEAFLSRHVDDALAQQLRQIEGRLVETDTGWLPALPSTEPVMPSHGVVLHLVKESVPFFDRGYTIRSHNTFLAQQSIGLRPEVITHLGFPRSQGIDDFPTEDVVDDIRYHRLDLGPRYPYRGMPFDMLLDDHATAALKVATKVKPEFVQAGSGYRGYETALVGLAIAKRLSIPFIYEIRSFFESTWTGDTRRAAEGEQYERRYAQELRCLMEADHVITISESMHAELVNRGVPSASVTVVPNAIDIDHFYPRTRREDLADELGLSDTSVIGYVSNLGSREGHDDLISAGAVMRSWGHNVKVLIVGEGPERERLESHASSMGMTDHVVFTGAVPHREVADYYKLIDVFVVPRVDERVSRLVTPLKPLEAMALDVPVISSDLPALRELVEPGKRGEVFEPSNVEEMAKLAVSLLEDPDRVAELTAASRQWVVAERSWDANAKLYAAVFDLMRSQV